MACEPSIPSSRFPCLVRLTEKFRSTLPPVYSRRRWVVIPLYLIYDSGKVILSALDRQQEGKKTA